MKLAGGEPFPKFMVDSKKEGEKWEEASQAQRKKVGKLFVREQAKTAEREKKEAADAERREKNLEEAKKITIKEDPSLPAAKKCSTDNRLDNRHRADYQTIGK
ncbi:putative asparagine--tRNA ligase, cytoplasmic [Apostichopus japonicus]|uniref:Putative asparagine--tRNA ligase, cytoplasmic n=1 Tax=Stichopus japonicus TaxID=307972 RepID=A0A2G8KWH5_STIJA|nr:putative asparagine--tRNA ligase, cytoplasmic [Apostichopus japonicus]